ncbi:polysaccharide biosynthesis C-terminal domain-containing protein [Gangjinia marincola]|uniref:Polysaccharide biosynthesis C-terminal domain-containing protein n=1 Tax=Gangjinia marincola TaxID=578463 RepID=A0ABN1MHY2_9FLAO
MSVFKKLFQQTFIYGLATVLPRAIGFILVPLFTSVLKNNEYGVYASLMGYLILGNVLLSYGMETAFFRFVNKHKDQKAAIQSTTLTSLTISTLIFIGVAILCRDSLANLLDYRTDFITYGLLILGLDALAVLPFVWYRANERPLRYATIKIINVLINLLLNIFFLVWLPKLALETGIWRTIYVPNHQIAYIFIANLIASAITLGLLSPLYAKIRFGFDATIWKGMMKYALPVLVAGLAFTINEALDKILLRYLLPDDIADSQTGIYSACYKIGVFMALFGTAFRLGIEPFFFNHASAKNAQNTYAQITLYFSIFGSIILLAVIAFQDNIKRLLIPDSSYWEGIEIVPIILLANLCLGLYHNLSVWYKITDRTKFGAYISVVGAVITIAINIIFIPLYGYMASAVATLMAYATMMVLSYSFGRKYYKVPYNLKKILGYVLTATLFSAISFYGFRQNLAVGIGLLVLFIGLVYWQEQKQLKRIFAESKST